MFLLPRELLQHHSNPVNVVFRQLCDDMSHELLNDCELLHLSRGIPAEL